MTARLGHIDFIERSGVFWTLFAITIPLQFKGMMLWIPFFFAPFVVVLVCWTARITLGRAILSIGLWDGLLAILGVSMIASTFLNAPQNLGPLGSWLAGLLLAFYARHNFQPGAHLGMLVTLAYVVVTIQVGLSLLQWLTESDIGLTTSYFGTQESQVVTSASGIARVVGTLGHPNLVGSWMIMLLPFLLLRATDSAYLKTGLRRVGAIVLVPMAFVPIGLAVSRWTFAVGIMILVWFWIWPKLSALPRDSLRHGGSKHAWVGVLAFGLSASALLFVASSYGDPVAARLEGTEDSFTFRSQQYAAASSYLTANPLIGTGLEAGTLAWDYGDPVLAGWPYRPHNVFLTMGVEGGLPALVAFTALAIYPFALWTRRKAPADVAFIALALSGTAFLLVSVFYINPAGVALWPFGMFILGALSRSSRFPFAEGRRSVNLKKQMRGANV